MLSEEALIVLVAFGACALLALGVAELLWPARRRHPAPRPGPAAAAGPAVETADVPPPIEAQEAVDPVVSRPPRIRRTSALARHRRERGRSPYVRRAPARDEGDGAAHPGVAVAEALALPRVPTLVERCVALHQARRHAEAIALAMAEVHPGDATQAADPQRTAALWGVIAAARQALGEHAEARTALVSAIDAAPESDRPAYVAQLTALASEAARALVADADAQKRADSEERVTLLGQATTWLEGAMAASPDDAALTELATNVQARLWSAYERTVLALVHRQEFRAARRLLRQALADPRAPAGYVATFHELFSATFSGEIGQLTAQAIRGVQDGRETDAVVALQRVEALLERLSDEALSRERREEVGRRLSWGYRKLGERRLEAGDEEGALDPLMRVLVHEADAERRREVHALLVRALGTVTDARATAILNVARHGERAAAIAQCETLSALVRAAADRGVPSTDLADVFAQVRRLVDGLKR